MYNKKCCLNDANHPFGTTYHNGICSGCITHLEKNVIDWDDKKNDLKELSKKIKSKSSSYNCVVPICGDAEDYFVVNQILKLNLNPLIVAVNNYFNNDIGWFNIQNLVTYFDLDSIIFHPDLHTYKQLVRTSLRKHKSIYLPFLNLHTSFPFHIAKERNIPLVVWGGHQSIEQVGKFSHHDMVESSAWSRKENDLFGNDIGTLIGNGAEVNEKGLEFYFYPKIQALGRKVVGIYLSNYIRWDPLLQNHSCLPTGFKPQNNNYSFDVYERSGSSVYYQFHDLLRFDRHGYRKVRDQLNREIRHGRVTFVQATKSYKTYSKKKVYIKPFFRWLGVSKTGYDWFIQHKLFKSRRLIAKDEKDVIMDEVFISHEISKYTQEKHYCVSNFLHFSKQLEL